MWNETTGELIFEHNALGANRVWDFYLPPHTSSTDLRDITSRAWLVYTSKSEVHQLSWLIVDIVAFPQSRQASFAEECKERKPWS